jgi:hypothetical protein
MFKKRMPTGIRFTFIEISTHRVLHHLSPDQMQMDVEHGLPAVLACVHNEAITALVDTFLIGQFSSGSDEVSHQWFVRRIKCVNRFDVIVRYDQDMRRRGGINVTESRDLIVTVNNIPWNFA